jgi:hypothetical protein
MAYTTIDKPDDYFNTVLYTGNGTVESDTQAITGVGFLPDLVWIKMRSGTDGNILEDSVRGVGRYLISNSTGSEAGGGTGLLDSFDSDGFTVNCDEGGNLFNTSTNGNGSTYASWNWLANGAGVSNTDGSITSTVSANTTSGFSIVSYTGNATGGATVGHGLGVVPKMIIIKIRSGVGGVQWVVYHVSTGNTQALYLNTTATPTATSGFFNNTTPSSTVFTLGTDTATNSSGNPLIAYCFAEKKGFSKFGSYTGNGNADGTFVYTGFKPAFVMVKQTNTARYWAMFDNKRLGYNPTNRPLFPNASDQESDSVNYYHDILSNGFKWRTNSNIMNESGGTYIYMAFAENPFVTSTSVPTTAR